MYDEIVTAISSVGHAVEVKKHDEPSKVIFVINGVEVEASRFILDDSNVATACNLLLSIYQNEKRRQ